MGDPDLTCNACGAEVLEIDVKCETCGAPLASTGALRLIGGTVLDHYVIVEVLGQGGMSIVYKGKHKLTGQEVALKILPPELAAHQQVKSRFIDEARALAQLDHANIVHLYNFGEDNGCFVLAMQFVRGQTLERLIWTNERLDWRLACKVGIDTLKALEYAHRQGVVHRDMKPSNILIRESDKAATVMDFGIAKMTTSTRLTATGQTMGTVRYMSPEQVRGQDVDPRTDLYSFGISLYEALVGDTPFDGETHFEIMTKHLGEAPTPPSKQNVELPAGLEAVLMKCIAKNPADRPASASEVRAILEALIEGESIPELEISETQSFRPSQLRETAGDGMSGLAGHLEPGGAQLVKRTRPWLWLALLFVALAVISAAGAMLVTGSGEAEEIAGADAAAEKSQPPAPRWPDPHLIGELKVVSDQRFPDSELRIITTSAEIEPASIEKEILGARQQFTEYLRGAGVGGEISWEPLNVVVVEGRFMCHPRLYERETEAPPNCVDQHSHYRPYQKTLYLVEDRGKRARGLPYDVGVTLCVHRTRQIPECDRTLTAFLRDHVDLD